MFLHYRGLARLGLRGRRLACDEENRAFCSLEQLRRNLTKEKLVAGPRAYAHHQEIVTTDLELTENGFLRRPDASHRASHLDPIMISQPDDLADDGFCTGCWGECRPDVTLPRASPSLAHWRRGGRSPTPAMLVPGRLPAPRLAAKRGSQ